ncbi:sensor histidine kinase [Cohnella pontilimi]|uniref:histidine kinase n=1 Tax=Cohnella pontilimi TaxID=2564100 RepID=A0A4U0FCB0_9BACL|nr:sensor histidine kinase [Cohnella pontilimi]TJY42425.1 sensor histidine kinase [Cohnella pontilimi]
MLDRFRTFGQNLIFLFSTRIRVKLLVFFLCISVVPLMTLGIMSYNKASEIVDQQFGKYGEYAITQLQLQVDNYMKQVLQTSNSVLTYLMDPTLISLQDEKTFSYAEYLNRTNFVKFLENSNSDLVKDVYVVTNTGFYYGSNKNLDVNKLQELHWWKSIAKSSNERYWTHFFKPDYYIKKGGSQEDIFSVVVPINNKYGVLQHSKILIETRSAPFIDLFKRFAEETNSSVIIRNESNEIIYQDDKTRESLPDDIVWQKKLSVNDWNIEARIPHATFYLGSKAINTNTYLLIAITVVFASLLTLVFSSYLTKRIQKLRDSMKRFGEGDLNARVMIYSRDELGQLAKSFNSMVGQINSLIDKISRTEKLKLEADLRAFHHQINPHMFLNTLSTIQWKALMSGDEQTHAMLGSLAHLLEEHLDDSQEYAPLSKELLTVENFLEIQKIRYGSAFAFHLDIEPSLSTAMVPRMILQPLLENTFFHGFEDGHGTIKLSIYRRDEYLELSLHDDGKGIAEDKISGILDPNRVRTNKRGIGLLNVQQKIKLQCGDQYGLTVFSKSGEGTTITITLPLIGGLPNPLRLA